MYGEPELRLELQDAEWPLEFINHDRKIARAIVYDKMGNFYFVRAVRDDDFGTATLIETAGGGVEQGEDLIAAIKRELKEELGVQVDVLCKIGVISDYYNLIHRHNINHYFLCQINTFGEKNLTVDEIENFHLSTLKLTYEEAVREYENRAATKLGRLVANRELPILKRAKEIINKGLIKKYTFGKPFQTESIVLPVEACGGMPPYGTIHLPDENDGGFTYSYHMNENDIVYGLGEANRGINKRGFLYTSFCSDNPNHLEDTVSLYGAHNFIIISGSSSFGLYIDCPSSLTFDIGYTRINELVISCRHADLDLYIIEGKNAYDITKQFRKLIGRSYIPPKFAFGFGQSRWGYKTQKDFWKVADGYRKNHIPIDMIYMDIDYMDDYKDFTVSKEFADFPAFVSKMKKNNIRLIPIIDAGVKIEPDYEVYEEGVANNYFCKRWDGSDFVAAVWPGYTHFPDFFQPEVRQWFGSKYQRLTEQGIEGFWNDMNEPATFYTPEGIRNIKEYIEAFFSQPLTNDSVWEIQGKLLNLANAAEDYRSFYHNIQGNLVCHDTVHNLYGFQMTRAAGEALQKISPDKRCLLFSRSSYIGMHRYGGIWTGDNKSWWSHLLLNLKMLPSLNMCGFLYIGADLGGFGSNTTRDLLLRWLALGVFTPLMRNHTALGTREQECYRFEHVEDFRHIIGVRYRLLPYLYSEYMKAALNDDMYFKPLAFEYPDDEMAANIEDQLMLGNEIMIAPVYTQNANGRYVYLPEEMILVRFLPNGTIDTEILPKGHHYISVPLNVVPLFIRYGKCIPIAGVAECVAELDTGNMEFVGYKKSSYVLYEDDGYTRNYDMDAHCRVLEFQ